MTIGYTCMGKGDKKVVVLPGWLGDHTVFKPTFNALDLENFTYIFIDYRGYGKSKKLTGDYSMAEIAGDVIALVDEMNVKQFHLIGHSMGGMAIQKVILDIDQPERVLSAIAITPVPACGSQLDEASASLCYGSIDSDKNRYDIFNFGTSGRLPSSWLHYYG